MQMVTTTRWETAQKYEQDYWKKVAGKIAEGSAERLEFYRWRADQLTQRLRRLGLGHLSDGTARAIEIGGGPIGLNAFFAAAERVAVDPLEEFYGSNRELGLLRPGEVQYRNGVGEEIPADDGAFDIAIIENCIDHTKDAHAVMRELRRVLRSDAGVLYLTVNARSRIGYFVHRMLSKLALDPGHPYTFTPRRALGLIERHGFEIVDVEVGSFGEAWLADLRSGSKKDLLKGLLGVSEYIVSIIARRKS